MKILLTIATILISLLLAFTSDFKEKTKVSEGEKISIPGEITCWSQLKPRDDYKATFCPSCVGEDDYVRDGGEGECTPDPIIN